VVGWSHEARHAASDPCRLRTIRLNKKEKTPLRLAQVYAELIARITQYEPDCIAH